MRRLLIPILLLCCGPGSDALRAQVVGGNISGVVADPSGAAIPRAKTVLKSLDTQILRTALANEEGFYAAPNLVPGLYEVTVSAAGFESQVSHISLATGAEAE